jgi:hypothetical protein
MDKANIRIYISGKITGDENYKQKFEEADDMLTDAGYSVVNPALLTPDCDSWTDFMRRDIRALMRCDAVALLPDWQDSRGAKIEERLARDLGMDVRPIADWLGEGENG